MLKTTPDIMDWLCYLNGDFLPIRDAAISPLDRGFLFADGGYDVIPVFARRPFRLDAHLARFAHTLESLQLPVVHTASEWRDIFGKLVREAPGSNLTIYVQITRGTQTKRTLSISTKPEPTPTIFAYAMPMAEPTFEERESGISAITAQDLRWQRCDLKSTALLANILHKQQAEQAGAQEALLIRDGFLTEGISSSIFIVKNNTIIMPNQSQHTLPGTTADVVVELASLYGVPLEKRPIAETELMEADEIWATSSSKGVISIAHLNGHPIGTGKPGPMGKQMHACYSHLINEETKRNHD